MNHDRSRVAAAILGVTLALAGCSGGGAADHASQVSQPTTPAPTVAATTTTPATDPYADFKTAVKFTKLAHTDKYEAAKELVAPGSAADRYVIHQLKLQKAYRVSGQDPGGEEPNIDSDKGNRSIRIEFTGEDGYSYTWKYFTLDQGKVTGWTGKSGPVASVLWSRDSKDSALGATARLASAYRSNAGSMFVVVEFSTKRDVDLAYTSSYAAKGGYRQNASDSSGEELAKGEKTLVYYTFDDAKFGGKLRLKIASASGYSSTANLELRIR